MTPRSLRLPVERDAFEADVDGAKQMQNQLTQVDAAGSGAASPPSVITQHEESRVASNVGEFAAATEVFDYEVPDFAHPLDFFQAVGPAGLLEERAQVGAD